MPRIPYRDLSQLPESARKLVEATPINAVRLQAAASPAVFEGFHQFSTAFYTKSKVPPDLRELAILRVGYLDESLYETFQHEEMARRTGFSDAQIAAIKRGGKHPGVLNAAQQAVLDFTDEIVRKVRAGDETLAALRKHFSDEMVVDLIMIIGFYMIVTRLLETGGVEMEDTPTAWKSVAQHLQKKA